MDSPAFIWDLDGTLFDSYAIIVSAVAHAFEEQGIPTDREAIFTEVTATSVTDFVRRIAGQYGCDESALFQRCCFLQTSQDDHIQLNPHAASVLQQLHQKGAIHFVCTHKGTSAPAVLERLGIKDYFREIITAGHGFARKPDPEGVNYLVHKYNLNKKRCYYVGDRKLDLECAANAQIKSILYLYSPSSCQAEDLATYCVNDLQQILDLNV